MPLTSQVVAYLENKPDDTSIENHSPAVVRAAKEAVADAGSAQDLLVSTEDRVIPGPNGPIPVRIFQTDAAHPRPIVMYFHGGGWVIGSLNTHSRPCRGLARLADSVVVSVGYRLAPEYPYPAGLEDCWAATAWAAENAKEIGGDARLLAVAGDSAGGNLAAVVALRARDRGVPLALQVLVYPNTDFRLDTESCLAYGEGYGLNRGALRTYWDYYVPDVDRRSDPEVSPLRASNVTGVAPAWIMVCEFDPLRDEGIAYAERLRAAGVPVTLRDFAGMIHGVFRLGAVIDDGDEAIGEAAAALSAAFVAAA
jgi:acetyl esterase